MESHNHSFPDRLALWIARGFGAGQIPVAPGTFGSFLGLGWLALLLLPQNLWIYLAGLAAGAALSVWLAGKAERMLQQTDPGSVVLDEIIAVPFCYAAWIMRDYIQTGLCPSPASFFVPPHLLATLALVAAFRLFDIWKPWPVRSSQRLPGGWGVTVDDLLAGVYVNGVYLLAVVFGWW